MRTRLAAVLALFGSVAAAQDVPYKATPHEYLKPMLELAQLRAGDVVYDLGCGDGRIVIAAVKRASGIRGVCVEIDPKLLQWSRDNAAAAGVTGRIKFVEGDFFKVPISDASVVCLYLPHTMFARLRPRLLAELRPGARVITLRQGVRIVEPDTGMGDWKPDTFVDVDKPFFATLYRFTVPRLEPRR
jgi:ubiquinone/menaquinone biosynthesis C-methylase UbiE